MSNMPNEKPMVQSGEEKVEVAEQNEILEKMDELVERFYARLIQDPYYSRMFAERKVDLDVLKERQKVFITRLANGNPLQEEQGEVNQVRERHSFGVDPDRAKVWLKILTETMEEMGLSSDIKDPLLEKIHFLINKMV